MVSLTGIRRLGKVRTLVVGSIPASTGNYFTHRNKRNVTNPVEVRMCLVIWDPGHPSNRLPTMLKANTTSIMAIPGAIITFLNPLPGAFGIQGTRDKVAIHPDNVFQSHAVSISVALADFMVTFKAGHYHTLF